MNGELRYPLSDLIVHEEMSQCMQRTTPLRAVPGRVASEKQVHDRANLSWFIPAAVSKVSELKKK